MANTYHMVSIDSDKLRGELSRRMLISQEVSRSIGYSAPYISKTLSKGRCNRETVVMLEKKYGIQPDSYVISYDSEAPHKEQHTPTRAKESNQDGTIIITKQDLAEIVAEAVETAITKIIGKGDRDVR